jgi:hypothetical protein
MQASIAVRADSEPRVRRNDGHVVIGGACITVDHRGRSVADWRGSVAGGWGGVAGGRSLHILIAIRLYGTGVIAGDGRRRWGNIGLDDFLTDDGCYGRISGRIGRSRIGGSGIDRRRIDRRHLDIVGVAGTWADIVIGPAEIAALGKIGRKGRRGETGYRKYSRDEGCVASNGHHKLLFISRCAKLWQSS